VKRAIASLVAVLLATCEVLFGQSVVRIHFLDVGQGDAVLIETPSGPNVLYDAGDSPAKIVSHLERLSISRVDLIIASHNHADHIGGMSEVVRRYRPRYYMDNGIPATTLTYRRLIETVASTGAQLLEPTHRKIKIASNAELTILPPPGVPEWEQNNNTVGAVLNIRDFRLTLAGDAEQRQWSWWLERHQAVLRQVTVHKASHHGSNNGDTAAALAVLRPGIVIISVGANNGYGHPRSEALSRLIAIGSTIYRTDLHGSIVVAVDSSGRYVIQAERAIPTTLPETLLRRHW
jgi:competence protein ComEC